MVERHLPQLDVIFHALGDATRREMLRQLVGGERTVSELADPFAISSSLFAPAPRRGVAASCALETRIKVIPRSRSVQLPSMSRGEDVQPQHSTS